MIETERLILREWEESDIEPFAKLNADPDVMEYFPSTLSTQETEEMVSRIKEKFAENGFGFWAVELKSTGDFTGFVGLNIPHYELPFSPCVEIGWRLSKEFWGKGIAVEAARAALKYAFSKLDQDEIVSFTTVDNRKSRSVMEKLGFSNTQENFMHPLLPEDHPLREHVLYRLSKSDWLNAEKAR